MDDIIIKPIGIIHSPHKDIKGVPIQPIVAEGIKGYIELFPEYLDGLKDLDGFSHITLLFRFHNVHEYKLRVIPFMDVEERGIFSCRAPKRPNRIGISTVRLTGIDRNIILIEEVDILDGTPLIDIKPFYPKYDNRENVTCGWLDARKDVPREKFFADERFR